MTDGAARSPIGKNLILRNDSGAEDANVLGQGRPGAGFGAVECG
jgi:hypothetical protein